MEGILYWTAFEGGSAYFLKLWRMIGVKINKSKIQ